MKNLSTVIWIASCAMWSASLGLAGCAASGDDDELANVEQASFGANLGSVVANPVATGGTAGGTNDNRPACSSTSTAPDMAYFWTAPATGTYTFSTVTPRPSFDTVLEVRNLVTGASLGCNDDSAGTLQSTVSVNMTSGQLVRVIVDGFRAASGAYALSIAGNPGANAPLYTCGYALPGFGCNNGRSSLRVNAADMTTAVTACLLAQPADRPDFCHVINAQGTAPTDQSQCTAAGGSWRPNNSCCNFLGTTSCP
jgi:hypothetical protein